MMDKSIKELLPKNTLTLHFCPKYIINIELYFSYTPRYCLLNTDQWKA